MIKTYKWIKVDGVYKHEHRYIIENILKRKLSYNEVVHHKDGNKFNNNIDNLELMSRKEHSELHNTIDLNKHSSVKCKNCSTNIKFRKKEIEYKNKHQRYIFCSHTCVVNYYKHHNKSNNKIDSKYKDLIEQGIKDNLSGYKIAKKYNLNNKTVYNYLNKIENYSMLKKINIDLIKEGIKNNLTRIQISEKYNISRSSTYKYLKILKTN